MLMPRRRNAITRTKRLGAGMALAVMLTAGIAVATWDPTESLCAIYTSDDPMWHLLACWRFPSGGSPQG